MLLGVAFCAVYGAVYKNALDTVLIDLFGTNQLPQHVKIDIMKFYIAKLLVHQGKTLLIFIALLHIVEWIFILLETLFIVR